MVGRVSEDVVLGMPFLAKHQCMMIFDFPVLSIAGKQVPCTDRHGRQLTSDIQAVRTVLIPPKMEQIVLARITSLKHSPMGLVEGMGHKIPLTSSLHKPNPEGQIWARCMNPGNEP